jgi:hypothetical protein
MSPSELIDIDVDVMFDEQGRPKEVYRFTFSFYVEIKTPDEIKADQSKTNQQDSTNAEPQDPAAQRNATSNSTKAGA